jgi:hypothetical protein
MVTADLRPPPDLVVIGVKRGGTTSLFRDLERHPAMCPLVPSARRLPLRENMKGVHYFDTGSSNSSRWYRSHFPTSLTRHRRTRHTGAAFTAEASPYYFFHPLAASRAADALTEATFVVMLRDPVERTVSHWAEQTRNGVEQLALADALDAEAARVGDADRRLTDGSVAADHAHEQQSYAAQSEYASSLARWFDIVGPERVLVLFSEDYWADPGTAFDRIAARIGVPPFPAADAATHRNAASRPAEIDGALERQLVGRFRPDVDRIAALLGHLPPWPRFFAAPAPGDERR